MDYYKATLARCRLLFDKVFELGPRSPVEHTENRERLLTVFLDELQQAVNIRAVYETQDFTLETILTEWCEAFPVTVPQQRVEHFILCTRLTFVPLAPDLRNAADTIEAAKQNPGKVVRLF